VFHILYRLLNGVQKITGAQPKGFETSYMDGSTVRVHGHGRHGRLVIYGLYLGRKHITSVFRKAFLGDGGIDDSSKRSPTRTSVFGIIAGSVLLVGWLTASGLNIVSSVFYLGLTFIVLIGISRIMSEGGFRFRQAAEHPAGFHEPRPAGNPALTPPGLAVLSGGYTFNTRHQDHRDDLHHTGLPSVGRDKNLPENGWFVLMIAAAVLISLAGSFLDVHTACL